MYRSADSAALAAGDYVYVATLGGNSDYDDATSGAHDEQFTVDKALLHITTDIHNSSHNIITSAFTNAVVHDTATVTGQVAGFPIESISFKLNGNPVGTSTTADPIATVTARSVDAGPLANGSYTYKAHLDGNSNYTVANNGDSADEPLSITSPPAWCSPGFWKNASDAAWMQTGLGTSATAIKNLKFNDYVVPDFYPTKYISAALPSGPTLIQVLNGANANTYGAAAGKYNLNAFNAVGGFLTSKLTGYAFTGNTSVGCPVSNGGVLTPPPTG